jgi:hypothetical protein
VSFAYRCNKCRGRNPLRSPLFKCWPEPKCKHCGHDKFYLDKARQYRNDYCTCEGYHWKHRTGSKFCIENPNYELNVRTERYGEDRAEVQLEIALAAPIAKFTPEEAPF